MRAQIAVSFAVGLLFSLGLCLSGMTQPQNILAFLDVLNWSPVLLFVMIGAIVVYAVGFRLVMGRSKPILAAKFEVPTRRDMTVELIGGAALFGIGWGLGGYCGGPAIVSLVSGQPEPFIFVGAMFVGTFLHKIVFDRGAATPPHTATPKQS
jgi:uncharacterized membrane protein YedE/YeeE